MYDVRGRSTAYPKKDAAACQLRNKHEYDRFAADFSTKHHVAFPMTEGVSATDFGGMGYNGVARNRL